MGLSRNEDILQSIVDGTQYTDPPKSRVEDLLLQVKEVIEEGGGGTGDYDDLENKPQINGVTLSGDKSASDLSLASLDANGKVPAAQLPSYVDDVINGYLYEGHFYEDSAHTTEITGESGKIYVDLETNKTYRWSGLAFVEISESLALGETASTAYAGDKGKANADAITAIKDGQTIDSFGDVETALAGKQDALTAGQYIKMQGSTISVNRSIAVNTERKYVFRGSAGTRYVDTYVGDVLQSTTTCNYMDGNMGHHVFNDELDVIYNGINYWIITNLKASTTQQQGYVKNVLFQDSSEYTQIFEIELDADKKLIIQSELDVAVNTIKDGQSIDSFADVETALASKADLTDLAPAFSTATAYTVGQYVSYDGNIYKCTSAHSAGAWVAGDFTLVAVGGELESKQNATDNNLQTTDKTVVGAVNELKSGLTTLDNEVNGDATVYPYADVITIPDAVPANLADCSVKVEPVQDLHGYDKPWVGGAGKNKLRYPYTHNSSTGSYAGITATVNDDGSIRFAGTASIDYYFKIHTDDDKLAIKAGTWTVSSANAIPAYIGVYVGSTYLNNSNLTRTLTYAEDTEISLYVMIPTSAGQVDFTLKLQLEAGDTPTAWSPWSNICPITGHTEASVQRDSKNLVDLADVTGTSGTVYGATKLLPAGTYYGYFFGEYQAWNHFYQYSLDGVNYTNFPTTDDGYAVADVSSGTYYHEKNKLIIHQPAYIRLGIQKNSSVGDNSVDALLTVDSTYYNVINDYTKTGIYYPKMYVPYAGKTYTIALGDTIYGGTVDFDSGVMTVDRAIGNLADLSWTRYDVNLFTAEVSGKKPAQSTATKDNIVCSCYDTRSVDDVMFHDDDSSIGGTSSNNKVFARDSRYDDATDLTTALSGQTFVYELATPFTVQLTPTQIQLLKGQNTLTASTGQISVTVNGVSGAIGAVQEQVNELAEEVAEIKPVNYSTTEQKTGQKWIDGKDIYFRTFTELTITTTGNWQDTGIDSSNMDTILGGLAIDDSKQSIVCSFGYGTNSTVILRAYMSTNVIKSVTLYYTKTA